MKYKLGDLLEIKHGYPFKGDYFSDEGEKIVLTPANFFEKGGFKYTPGKEKYYIGDIPEEYLCKKGDLIVAMTQQAEGLLGSTAFVPEDNRFLHNQRIGLISTFEEKLVPEYAYYLFRTKSVRKQIRGSASGTKVKHTSPEKIYDVEVDIPDITVQTKVANLLANIEKRVVLNNDMNKELDELAKILFDYWFIQFDFPDANNRPYKSSGGKMVWNEELMREIPAQWKVKHASDFLDVVTGKEDANHATFNGRYPFFTCSTDISRCDDYSFEGKSVLIAGNGDFNVKYYDGKFNAYQRTYVLIPKDEECVGVLYQNAIKTIDRFKKGSNGSIVKFITKSDVENIEVLIPDNSELIKPFNDYLNMIEANNKVNEELNSLMDYLLPLLMNGQVEV